MILDTKKLAQVSIKPKDGLPEKYDQIADLLTDAVILISSYVERPQLEEYHKERMSQFIKQFTKD